MRLVIESGLRKKHAIEAYNKIARSEGQEIGNGVYEVRLSISNNTKQAYVCYCSSTLAREIQELAETISEAGIHKINQKGVLFNAIRKWWTNVAIEAGMREDIIDFVQGRGPATVRAKYYINKLALARKQYPVVLLEIQRRIY